jgi:argininosuccinate synthase
VADVGQEEDFETAKKKALKVGAVAVYIEVSHVKIYTIDV